MSCSYGIVDQHARAYIIVNARPGDHHVDVVIVLKRFVSKPIKSKVTVYEYYQGIESVLLDDNGPPYTTYRINFTTNHDGSFLVSPWPGLNHESGMKVAKLVTWCEFVRATRDKALEQSVEITKFTSKEKEDGDLCVICHEEYQVDEMIGTLVCKHRYHEKCIKQWIVHKEVCPVCRENVIFLSLD